MIFYEHKINERSAGNGKYDYQGNDRYINRLTPKNQTYFMILVRLAEAAENGAKHRDAIRQSCGSSRLIALRQENESKENSDI